jgi:hypothetical protein
MPLPKSPLSAKRQAPLGGLTTDFPDYGMLTSTEHRANLDRRGVPQAQLTDTPQLIAAVRESDETYVLRYETWKKEPEFNEKVKGRQGHEVCC